MILQSNYKRKNNTQKKPVRSLTDLHVTPLRNPNRKKNSNSFRTTIRDGSYKVSTNHENNEFYHFNVNRMSRHI